MSMNGLGGEEALILGMDYTEESLLGAGALKGQDGKDGVSPVISVNTSTADTYKLDITDKNGTITTPNLVGKQGLQGIQGEQGKPADNPIVTENAENTEDVYKLDLTVGETVFTTKNIIGKQGLEGVSPSVTTNPDNTAEDYRLNITTKGGTFTTPNLRGPQGEIGPQGESAASAINPRGDYDVNADPHYTVSDYITSAEGNTYVCKKDNPDNVAPTDGTINDEFWQILALRGAQGIAGKDGEKGSDGVTFTPSIDANGVLSFTNNGGLENPEPIDIKGDNGVTFTPSIDADGYLSFTNNGNLENPEPIKVLGKDGVDGKDGADGTTYIPSIGTVTTVESNVDASAGVTVDEETKEAVFHFEIPKGEDGFSPIVETVESENGHAVNITDVEGVKSFEVLNGKDGVQIDDTTTSTDTVWSSKKTSDEIAKVDASLGELEKNVKFDADDLNTVYVPNKTITVRTNKNTKNLPPSSMVNFLVTSFAYIEGQYYRITQYCYENSENLSYEMYVRRGTSNAGESSITWSAWQELATMDKVGSTDISSIGDGTVTGAIDTINTSLANYSIPLNLYMGIKHYLAIKINTHNMNYSFNMSDRSGNIYEGSFFSYSGSFSIQITKVNNSSTKNGYILGFRQYKVSDNEIYLVAKVSDYNYINGVINTPSILKSNIEILVNDDSTLWDKGTDIVVSDLAKLDDSSTSETSTWSSSKIASELKTSSNTDKVIITPNTEYFTQTVDGYDSFYVVRNGVCYVNLDIVAVKAGFGVFKTMLPKPIGNINITISPFNVAPDDLSKNGVLVLYATGTTYSVAVLEGRRYMCNFSYPIA